MGNIFYSYKEDNSLKSQEISLWRAVILQACIDLQTQSQKKLANTFRIKSLLWFNENNENFKEVCINANLDYRYVLKKVEHLKELARKFKMNRK